MQKVCQALRGTKMGQLGRIVAMESHSVWLFRGMGRLVNKIRNHLAAIIITLQMPVCFAPQPHEAGG
jgi:hypothetical protein